MVQRAQSRLWDHWPPFCVMLVWIAFGCSVILYFSGWPASLKKVPNPQDVAEKTRVSNDELYTGSIITIPASGNQCAELMLDNRTGRMWDKGFVDCDEVVSQLIAQKQQGAYTDRRIRTISKTFRNNER